MHNIILLINACRRCFVIIVCRRGVGRCLSLRDGSLCMACISFVIVWTNYVQPF